MKSFIKNKNWKEALVGAFFLFQFVMGFSQQTFNVTYDLGLNTLGMCVMEKNDGFLTASLVLDTLDGYYFSIRIAGIDTQGQVEFVKEIGSLEKEYSISSDANLILGNGEFIIAGHRYDSYLEIGMASVLWLNEWGDTIKTVEFASPYAEPQKIDDNSFIVPTYLATDSIGNIYVSCHISNNTTFNDFVIQQILPSGELGWQYVYATEADPDLCYALVGTEDGVIIGAGVSQSTEINPNLSHVFKLNSIGMTVEWEITDDQYDVNPGYCQEMVLKGDTLTIASGLPSGQNLGLKPLIYQVEISTNEILWSSILGDSFFDEQRFYGIVNSQDNGFVAIGWQHQAIINDTLNGDYNWNAWMVKFSHDGNIEWERFFHYVESTQDKHRVYDLKATSEGGYIFCGEATDLCIAPDCHNSQQGWLVKVDGCGCLVPGCDPNCSTDTTDYSFEQFFISGPNPFADYLNIYVGENLESDVIYQMQLHDMSGKLVNEFSFSSNRITYLWNLENIAHGNYVLSLRRGDEILQAEKVVKR